MPEHDLPPGSVIAERYRVDAILGQGGYGVVYRATQLALGRVVALKMLLPRALRFADGLARFRREAALAQRLAHPNTVRIFDFGETPEGLPFIVWELVRGRSIDQVLATEGRFDVARALRVASQILRSLAEAHAAGVIHRDIKPQNVLLCDFPGERDFVKVLDFGIAKSTLKEPGTSVAPITDTGAIVGTPSYMAPEQVMGRELAPATDIYSLGLVLAEMLTGRVVFGTEGGFAVCMAQVSDAPAPIPDEVKASPLGPIVLRATRKAAAQRFGSAGEMLALLESLEVGILATAPIVTPRAVTPAMSAPTGVVATPPRRTEVDANTAYVAPMPSAAFGYTNARPIAPTAAMITAYTPPPAAAPPLPIAAPPAGRGGALAVVGLLVVLLVATTTVAALFVTGRLTWSDSNADAPMRTTGDEPPTSIVAGRRFAQIGAREMRRRIDRTKEKVTSETVSGDMWQWTLESGVVLVQKYPMAEAASFAASTSVANPNAVAGVDGTMALIVISSGRPAARKLFDAIAPP